MNLNDLLQEHIKAKNLSIYTIKKYQQVIKIFYRDTNINTINVSYQEVINWIDQLIKRVKPVTCNTYHRHMTALFSTAVKMGYIEQNPFKLIKKAKVSNNGFKCLSESTYQKLVNTIKLHPYYSRYSWFYIAMIDTLKITAIRRRQLIGIKWEDIDFDNMTLTLNSEYSKNKMNALIPINDQLAKHFKILQKKSIFTPKEQVFNITKFITIYKSDEMNEDHITQLFIKWSTMINEKVSAHRFRHTAATKLVNSGINIKVAQQLLNHSNIKTTLNYIATDLSDLRKAQAIL